MSGSELQVMVVEITASAPDRPALLSNSASSACSKATAPHALDVLRKRTTPPNVVLVTGHARHGRHRMHRHRVQRQKR
jgi:hypothetical protein